METLRRGLDERFDELRRGSLLREHGWTMAFASVGLVALRFLSADWSGPSFADRLIGVATLADVDIAARGGVFAQCLVLFVASWFATGYVAPRVARALGHDAWRAVEGTSAAGLILILLATWRVQVTSTLVLPASIAFCTSSRRKHSGSANWLTSCSSTSSTARS